MQRKLIRRGGILSAGYDRASRILEIEFDTHRVMQYHGVGEEIARRLISSASPMSHFRDEIDGEYTVTEAPANTAAPGKKTSTDALRTLFGG